LFGGEAGSALASSVAMTVIVAFMTGGMESLSPDDAIEVAKRIIDGHGLI
jgi:hypothetical protein